MKLMTPQLSVPTAMCKEKMLPRSVRKSEDNLPKLVAGRYPRRGENSGHGADRCTATPEENGY